MWDFYVVTLNIILFFFSIIMLKLKLKMYYALIIIERDAQELTKDRAVGHSRSDSSDPRLCK